LDPSFLSTHQMLAVLYARLNRRGEALDEAAKAVALSGNSSRGKATLAMVTALIGKHSEARALLIDLKANPAVPGFQWGYALAAIHSYLIERDAAFECLNEACDAGDGSVIYLRHDPNFIELRDNSRFTRILERIGL
jgi:predicted Zn-dependent protease